MLVIKLNSHWNDMANGLSRCDAQLFGEGKVVIMLYLSGSRSFP